MIETILIVVVILLGVYGMYLRGMVISYSKVALVFIRDLYGKRATFSKCSAHMRRLLRLERGIIYHFTLYTGIEAGELMIRILDHHKQVIYTLDQDHVEYDLEAINTKYYLDYTFVKATGKYTLEWQKKTV